jgi:hypothetical protein
VSVEAEFSPDSRTWSVSVKPTHDPTPEQQAEIRRVVDHTLAHFRQQTQERKLAPKKSPR